MPHFSPTISSPYHSPQPDVVARIHNHQNSTNIKPRITFTILNVILMNTSFHIFHFTNNITKSYIATIILGFATTAYLMNRILRRRKSRNPVGGKAVKSPKTVIMSTARTDASYDKEKDDLLKVDLYDRWDAKARKEASEDEIKAQKIVWRLREHERDNLFGNTAGEALPGPDTRAMGGQFLTNKERIGKSDVYKIALNAPKGNHLHLHFNAELAPDELIKKAEKNEWMWVRCTEPLVSESSYTTTEVVFSVLPLTTLEANIFDASYKPNFRDPNVKTWMKWKTFRKEYEKRRGVPPEDWIKEKLILSEDEVYNKNQTTNG